MEDTRVFKRYANRKLYDTYTSSYVSLTDLAGLVNYRSIKVIDNVTGEDITANTLLKMAVKLAKGHDTAFTIATLESVVRTMQNGVA